jgi:gliding motility-associated-like protein
VSGIYLDDMWEFTPDSATQACCSTQVVLPPPNPEASNLTVPNVFTPNADGTNDLFFITSKNLISFSCEIYDRWGVKIYEWSDNTTGWNGKDKNGNLCSDGVYYYIVDATGIDGAKYKPAGFFTLIK